MHLSPRFVDALLEAVQRVDIHLAHQAGRNVGRNRHTVFGRWRRHRNCMHASALAQLMVGSMTALVATPVLVTSSASAAWPMPKRWLTRSASGTRSCTRAANCIA